SGGKKMVSDGLSASSVPFAPGAPCGQSSSTLVASGGVLKTSASVIRVQLMGKLILSLSLAVSRSLHIQRARNSKHDDQYRGFLRDSTILPILPMLSGSHQIAYNSSGEGRSLAALLMGAKLVSIGQVEALAACRG